MIRLDRASTVFPKLYSGGHGTVPRSPVQNLGNAVLEINRGGEAKARGIFQAFAAEIVQRPSAYTQLLTALDFSVGPSSEIVIAGKNPAECREFIDAVYEIFLPNKVVLFRTDDNQPSVAICQNHACQLPVHTLRELTERLKKDDEKIIR